jgi:putative oxidoreductase
MKIFEEIKFWGNHHQFKWLFFLRIALGLILIWKGIEFILNLGVLTTFLRESGLTDKISASVSITLLSHLIITLHLIGGVCITLGIRTRLFCIINLPVLLGAVFVVTLRQNVLKPYSEPWLSIFVLLSLICFLIEGSGFFAIERDIDEKPNN